MHVGWKDTKTPSAHTHATQSVEIMVAFFATRHTHADAHWLMRIKFSFASVNYVTPVIMAPLMLAVTSLICQRCVIMLWSGRCLLPEILTETLPNVCLSPISVEYPPCYHVKREGKVPLFTSCLCLWYGDNFILSSLSCSLFLQLIYCAKQSRSMTSEVNANLVKHLDCWDSKTEFSQIHLKSCHLNRFQRCGVLQDQSRPLDETEVAASAWV